MSAGRLQTLEAFLRKPDPAIAAILIHGDDAGEVHDLAGAVAKKIIGSNDDPFNVVTLEETALSGDVGRIADEVQALSFFGGRRVVWVRSAGASFLKAMEPILAGRVSGNLVVAESASLQKSSALRMKFEESAHALAIALYEASAESAAERAELLLKRAGFTITAEALALLVELTGTSSPLIEREIEKLVLHAGSRRDVERGDVEALCGAGAEITAEELIDAVLGGHLESADRQFSRMLQAGADAGVVLSALLRHLQRLADLRLAIEKGVRAEQALRAARPPIFFKRHGPLQEQLGYLGLNDVLSAAATVAAAIPQVRLSTDLAASLASRTILSIARNARALRQSAGRR